MQSTGPARIFPISAYISQIAILLAYYAYPVKHRAPLSQTRSKPHMKCRAVLRPRFAPVVETGGGEVGVPEPFLDLYNVGRIR
jgi:hypothetical protein